MNSVLKIIPQEMLQDRYWKGALHIFMNCPKLQRYVVTHIDFDVRTINAAELLNISKPWSRSEKCMLRLALHLFNEQYAINLSDIDYLDQNNKEIALKAIRLRFAG